MWVYCKRCAMLHRWWAAAHHKVIHTNLQQASSQATPLQPRRVTQLPSSVAGVTVYYEQYDCIMRHSSGQRQHTGKYLLHAVQRGCLIGR
jgi:hypothetical protein